MYGISPGKDDSLISQELFKKNSCLRVRENSELIASVIIIIFDVNY